MLHQVAFIAQEKLRKGTFEKKRRKVSLIYFLYPTGAETE